MKTAQKIKVDNSPDAEWVSNLNIEGDWTLQRRVFTMGKNWMHDTTKTRIYGWVEREIIGDNAGKTKAFVPIIPTEEDPDSDCRMIGYFDSMKAAMAEVVKVNHPNLSGVYI